MRACVISNNSCLAPAGYRIGGLGGMSGENESANCRLTCFACGEPVCSKCSKKIECFNYGKQVICDNCREGLTINKEVSNG